ncbi:unnamed protein product [Caenorhabditis bovis]|uniref:Methyltransferase FkbM domain-containing protein n=1 Tax=Caenorhabditis bovis TaxID=2654633 RepID=A0A8S1EJ77_9PELO|nr:unnamed protein product [Caenorhabditis bovis]
MQWRLNQRRYSAYRQYCLKIATFFVFFVFIYEVFFKQSANYSQHPHFLYLKKLESLGQATCDIPQLNPWDPSILSYYNKPNRLDCQPKQDEIVEKFENGTLFFNPSKIKNIVCTLTPIEKFEGVSDSDVDFKQNIPIDFSKGFAIPVDDEFFEVNCESKGIIKKSVFKYHYAQIIRKNETISKKPIVEESENFPSVIMIGIDSMSKSNFIRQLPKTFKHMKDTGFVVMNGHVKIHDNTYGNLNAILMGKRAVSVVEFPAEIEESWDIAFDKYPYIWKNFSDNGYATFFAEDRPDIGTFSYKEKLKGFLKKPTNHYMRTFWIAAFWSLIARRSSSYCYDKKPFHQIMFDYLEDFVQKYDDKRKFAFWWTQDISHDFLNSIGAIDDDFEDFFVRNENVLQNSIVIVFSDHGHRTDRIRETVVGRLESRLPFHAIRIPQNLRKKYPWIIERLEINSRQMTTQFDVYESLLKIARGKITKEMKQTEKKRAYSYFDEFSRRNGCNEAGVPSDYCPCFAEIEIPKKEAMPAATQLVKLINELLESAEVPKEYVEDAPDYYMCQPIEMDSIDYASVRLPSGSIFHNSKDLDVPLQHASLQYGNTSFCVDDRVLKKICHCILRSFVRKHPAKMRNRFDLVPPPTNLMLSSFDPFQARSWLSIHPVIMDLEDARLLYPIEKKAHYYNQPHYNRFLLIVIALLTVALLFTWSSSNAPQPMSSFQLPQNTYGKKERVYTSEVERALHKESDEVIKQKYYKDPVSSLDGLGYDFNKDEKQKLDPRYEKLNSLPQCDLSKDRDVIVNNVTQIVDAFHDCIKPIVEQWRGKPHQMILDWVTHTQKCDNIPEFANLNIDKFLNKHETKWTILPKCKEENSMVTLGVGHDTLAEERLNVTLPNTKFYGADPMIEPNMQLYSAFGKFFPFAIGRKAGMTRFRVLPNQNQKTRRYLWQDVTTIDIVYFLHNILGLRRIDISWIDIEGGEFEFIDYLNKGGPFDEMDISICQFNMKVHTAYMPKGETIFHDFIFQALQERRWVFLKPLPTGTGVFRMFFLNMENKECVRKFVQ